MIIIADSGSTKTDWALVGNGQTMTRQTVGINPCQQTETAISETLDSLVKQIPADDLKTVEAVYFYGSGVRAEKEPVMCRLLKTAFTEALTVEAHSDMLGACRAVCGDKPGYVCILGTGANSCYYDGTTIARSVPSLGYILGDEGSGAYLGKRLVRYLYGGEDPQLLEVFERDMHLSLPDIIERVYRQPMAGRFLASLVPFAAKHTDTLSFLLDDCFMQFIRHLVNPLNPGSEPVHIVGSIGAVFEEVIRNVAGSEDVIIGTILPRPLDALIRYHTPYNPNFPQSTKKSGK